MDLAVPAGGHAGLAYFEFAPPPGNEVSRVIEDAVKLAKAGVRMDVEELAEKTGYRVERSAFAKVTADGA